MEPTELTNLLGQLNGVYIPGDTKTTYNSLEFQIAVLNVLSWAQKHNSDERDEGHFPVVAMGYGLAAMLESQLDYMKLDPMPADLIGSSLQQNLNLLPKETFIYDEIPAEELERTFDLVSFYNELDVGLTLEHFNSIKRLRAFVPVATYHSDESLSIQTEFVSMVEGTYMPFFGFA